MFNIDHINELRAELNECIFTKDERNEIEAELAALIAERDAVEKTETDAFLEFSRELDAGC